MTKDEEYCDECNELVDNCECEEESTSLNDVLDGAKKGLDLLKTYKELTQPNSPSEIMKRAETEKISNYLQEDFARQQRISQNKNQNELAKENKEHRKWKINLVVAIVVPITIAIIGGIFYFLAK